MLKRQQNMNCSLINIKQCVCSWKCVFNCQKHQCKSDEIFIILCWFNELFIFNINLMTQRCYLPILNPHY